MKKFLSDHIKKIVIFSFAYIYLLLILVTPTDYAVTLPGGITQLENTFNIEGVTSDDHFYSVHVYSQDPITVFQYYLLKNNENATLEEISKRQADTSLIDTFKQGQISKESSYKTSLIKAYELAADQDDQISISYQYNGLIIYDYPRRIDGIDIGDLIIEVDGIALKSLDFNDSKSLAYDSDVTYTIEKSNGDIMTYHYVYEEDDVLFWFFPSYEIIDATPSFDYESLHLIGGSSGGLMQTLNIYVSLVNLNLKDMKIAGTGTIEMTGEIGRIGGIKQKIITANDYDMDVFFIPLSHVSDIEDMSYNFELIPVENVKEAIEWLYEKAV